MLRRVPRTTCLWVCPMIVSGLALLPAKTEGADRPKGDRYLSVHVLGSSAQNRDLMVRGDRIPLTTVSGKGGAGVKFGWYPGITRRWVGGEVELFAFGGKVSAPPTNEGGVPRSAVADFITLNGMVNLMLRYPGDLIQPYVGVGGGVSTGTFTNAIIRSQGPAISDGDGSGGAFATQFLAGLRVNATDRFFLFGEYKYFSADYKWQPNFMIWVGGGPQPKPSLELRAQIVSGGVGLRF